MSKWIALIFVLALLVSGCGLIGDDSFDYEAISDDLRGAIITPPREIDDFTLPSTTGEDFVLSDQEGKVVLLYFGYLACPDVCPATYGDLRRVYLENDEPSDKLTVLFITVDPDRDTLERMDLFLDGFHEDFIGLRGEGETLQAVMDSFGARASIALGDEDSEQYAVDHTASVFLIGPEGRLLTQFMYGTPYEDFSHDMKIILGELKG